MANDTIKFHPDGESYGNLFIKDGNLHFSGDVEVSAEIFIDHINDKLNMERVEAKGAFINMLESLHCRVETESEWEDIDPSIKILCDYLGVLEEVEPQKRIVDETDGRRQQRICNE